MYLYTQFALINLIIVYFSIEQNMLIKFSIKYYKRILCVYVYMFFSLFSSFIEYLTADSIT